MAPKVKDEFIVWLHLEYSWLWNFQEDVKIYNPSPQGFVQSQCSDKSFYGPWEHQANVHGSCNITLRRPDGQRLLYIQGQSEGLGLLTQLIISGTAEGDFHMSREWLNKYNFTKDNCNKKKKKKDTHVHVVLWSVIEIYK